MTQAQKALLEQALEAREHAYAPYSHFQVGAVLVAADGRRFSGCNLENASYSMTICAERCAVCSAVAAGVRSFQEIAIVGGISRDAAETVPCLPCGACLQVLSEFCPPDFPVCVCGKVPFGELVFRSPKTAADGELEQNPRSRSAKLRALRRIN